MTDQIGVIGAGAWGTTLAVLLADAQRVSYADREAWPRNPDACARYGRMCDLFDVCSGRAPIDDEIRFPRGRAHPELEAAI